MRILLCLIAFAALAGCRTGATDPEPRNYIESPPTSNVYVKCLVPAPVGKHMVGDVDFGALLNIAGSKYSGFDAALLYAIIGSSAHVDAERAMANFSSAGGFGAFVVRPSQLRSAWSGIEGVPEECTRERSDSGASWTGESDGFCVNHMGTGIARCGTPIDGVNVEAWSNGCKRYFGTEAGLVAYVSAVAKAMDAAQRVRGGTPLESIAAFYGYKADYAEVLHEAHDVICAEFRKAVVSDER